MTAPVPRLTPPSRPRRARVAGWIVVLAAGTCLLASGCSSGGASSGGTTMGTRGTGAAAPLPARIGAPAARSKSSGSSAAHGAALTALPLPGGQAVIFTATLGLRARDVQATVARATQLAESAGGYVSGEHASMTRSRHARAVVSIQFK